MSDVKTLHDELTKQDAERDDARNATRARVKDALPAADVSLIAGGDGATIRDEIKRRALMASLAGAKREQLDAVKAQVPVVFHFVRAVDPTPLPPIRDEDVAAHRSRKASTDGDDTKAK